MIHLLKKLICLALCSLLCFAALVACGGEITQHSGGAGSAPAPAAPETPSTPPPDPPQPTAPPPETIPGTLTMEDGGVITFELYPNIAPQSVFNFVYLARDGFYDGLKFHRIMSGFMIQGGCPDGSGGGNPGYGIFGEFAANGFENNLNHERGVLSMARQGNPAFNSAGSQFFICHGDPTFLNGEYAAFGRVTSGLDVVDRIAETPSQQGSGAVDPAIMPVIRSITIDSDVVIPWPDKLDR